MRSRLVLLCLLAASPAIAAEPVHPMPCADATKVVSFAAAEVERLDALDKTVAGYADLMRKAMKSEMSDAHRRKLATTVDESDVLRRQWSKIRQEIVEMQKTVGDAVKAQCAAKGTAIQLPCGKSNGYLEMLRGYVTRFPNQTISLVRPAATQFRYIGIAGEPALEAEVRALEGKYEQIVLDLRALADGVSPLIQSFRASRPQVCADQASSHGDPFRR